MKIAVAIILFFVNTASFSQEGSIDIPSLADGQVYLVNRTNTVVIFYLESASTDRTEHRLEPNSGAEYSGTSDDKWFNIFVYTNKNGQQQEITYGLNSGSRHYFEWNGNGILDVCLLPPN